MCPLLHATQPGEEYRLGNCNTSGNIGGHFDPTGKGPTSDAGYQGRCTPDMPVECEEGDLSGKHDTLTVSGNFIILLDY